MDKTIALGAAITAIGTAVTEVEYDSRSAMREALVVSLVGGIISGALTWLFVSRDPRDPKKTTRQKIVAVIVSGVVTFVASDLLQRLKVPLWVRAVGVGAAGGVVWVYFN